MEDNLEKFIRLVTDRSESNLSAILALFKESLYGQAIAILRQELDSLIRICFLLTLHDSSERSRLIEATLNGLRWKVGKEIIRDRKMVDIAGRYNHWAPEVYEFGNRFTHLTDYHDYKQQDPLENLDSVQKKRIKNYLCSYHQFPEYKTINFENVVPYLPQVAAKVSNNLSAYLRDLERHKNH